MIRKSDSNNLSVITNIFVSHRITDLIVVGYVDHEEYQQPNCYFHILFDKAYLIFDTIHIELKVVDAQVQISMAQKIEPIPYIDEDDIFCACSLRHLAGLEFHSENYVDSFECFLDDRSDLDQALFRTIMIKTCHDNVIFFDPMHFFGMHIGWSDYAKTWIKAYPELIESYGSFKWERNKNS